jgi:hypothetical protein
MKDDASGGHDRVAENASKGGKARAIKLSQEERRRIAVVAAETRWGKTLPVAEYTGVMEIGDLAFPCAVLSDGKTRVLTQSDFMNGMGMYYSGWVARNRSAEDRAAEIPHFLGFKSLKPFIEKHLGNLQSIIVKYRTKSGTVAHGIKAEIIPKICEIWLDADEGGSLGPRQKKIAAKAKILMRALAHKGIEALVDNATGFSARHDQQQIARFIQAYVAKDMRQWVRTFPRSFFEQLCKLRGIPFPEDMRLPQYFGHLINDLVWDRLAPGIKDELRRRNPQMNGRRQHKHHQFLTENVGNPRLLHHLGVLEGLAQGFDAGEYPKFYSRVNIVLPDARTLPLFAQQLEEPKRLKAGEASVESPANAPGDFSTEP